MPKCILVPVDGSEMSDRAVDVAAQMGRAFELPLTICHVVDPAKAAGLSLGNPQLIGGCAQAVRDDGESIVLSAALRAKRETASGVTHRLLQGAPAQEILRAAKDADAAWIVMGTHGRRGIGQVILGSVADGVLRHASVPVLVVPAAAAS